MKSMPIHVIPADHTIQQELLIKAVSTKSLTLVNAASILDVNEINNLLVLDQATNKLHLTQVSEVNNGDIQTTVVESKQLPSTLKVLEGIDIKLGREVLSLEKPHYSIRRYLILEQLHPHNRLYNFLHDEDIDGCAALKRDKKWGFLYYTQVKDKYTFRFEEIRNNIDGLKLTPTNTGYRDFTYFFEQKALPKAIKIGRTEDPDKRFSQLQKMQPRGGEYLLVLADGRMEPVFHSKFSPWLIEGQVEWFEEAPELLIFIDQAIKEQKLIISKFQNQEQNYENRPKDNQDNQDNKNSKSSKDRKDD